jgi:N-acetylneuraminic acid mutarotase
MGGKNMRKLILEAFCILLLGGAAEAGKWSRTGDLNAGRSGCQGAVLTNGRVMIIGSLEDMGNGDAAGYEIFDPATGSWSRSVLPITTDTYAHIIGMLLPDGNVLWIDGWDNVWLYNPRTETWNVPSLWVDFAMNCAATLLDDGDVLLMLDGKTCKLYDYATNTVTPTGSANANHRYGIEVMLPSGKVLATGGNAKKICEVYDPAAHTWSYTDSMDVERSSHVGVLLPPPWESVLLAGGELAGNKTELWDPVSGTFSYTGDMNFGPRAVPIMALLPSGEVLMVGGESVSRKCELYDPISETWTGTDDTGWPRTHCSSAILQTGKILAAGNWPSFDVESEIYDPSDGEWTAKKTLTVEREAATVTVLPIIHTDICSTNVLIAGGENSGGMLRSCELYNYVEETVALTGSLSVARTHHTSVLLSSGQVLVAGGRDAASEHKSCEMYDVSSETWTLTGEMGEARYDHTATLLKAGAVLVTGGATGAGILGSCEVYSAGAWFPAAAMNTSRTGHTAVLLLSGDILVIGGDTPTGVTDSCEIWNGTTWTSVAPLTTGRCLHTAVLLQSGKVLVIGGKDSGGSPLSSCEIYDPIADTWTAEASLNQARWFHNSILMYSGIVLVAGGKSGLFSYLSSCESYDPATHEWKTRGTLGNARACHGSALIPDHRPHVIAIGGKNNGGWLNSIEEYDVGLGYRAEWQSTITNHQSVTHVSNSMHVEGTLFRGVSEGDGGNYCHIISNDHPVLSFVRVGGGNFQGNGGGVILYSPLSSSWDTAHTDVDLQPFDPADGYYRLWSIVNGIPCKWYEECGPVGVEEGEEKAESQKPKAEMVRISPNPARQLWGLARRNRGIRLRVNAHSFPAPALTIRP